MALSTAAGQHPYACSCYYVFDPSGIFIIMSQNKSRHVKEMQKNCYVAGAIHTDPGPLDKIAGIQFTGCAAPLSFLSQYELSPVLSSLVDLYFASFPAARKITGADFWKIDVDFIKMTDNSVSFGYKRIWKKISQPASNSQDNLTTE